MNKTIKDVIEQFQILFPAQFPNHGELLKELMDKDLLDTKYAQEKIDAEIARDAEARRKRGAPKGLGPHERNRSWLFDRNHPFKHQMIIAGLTVATGVSPNFTRLWSGEFQWTWDDTAGAAFADIVVTLYRFQGVTVQVNGAYEQRQEIVESWFNQSRTENSSIEDL